MPLLLPLNSQVLLVTCIWFSLAHGERGAEGEGWDLAPLPKGKHSLQVLDSVMVRVTRANLPTLGIVEWFSLPVVHVSHHLHLQLRSQLLGSKRIHVNLAPCRAASWSFLGADKIVSTDPSLFTLTSRGWRTAFLTSRDHRPQ